MEKKKVLWLSAKNYAYDERAFSGADYASVSFAPITQISSFSKGMLNDISSKKYDMVIMIISEAIILMNYQEEYYNAFQELLDTIAKSGVNHIVYMHTGIFSQSISILHADYFANYVLYPYHEIHMQAFKESVVEKYYNKNHDKYDRDYVRVSNKYKRRLLDTAYASGNVEFLKKLLESPLYKNDYDEGEREFILKTTGLEVFLSYESLREYKVESKKYPMTLMDTEHNEVDFDTATKEKMKEVLPIKYYSQAKTYIRRFKDSRPFPKTYFGTLDRKMFTALLEMIGIDTGDGEFRSKVTDFSIEYSKSLTERNDLNYMPLRSVDDIYFQLEDYISELGHVVSRTHVGGEEDYVDEFDKLMDLFKDYITYVKKESIVIEKQQTSSGILYTINSTNDDLTEEILFSYGDDFRAFLNLVRFDIDKAEEILRQNAIGEDRIQYIVRKFRKEYTRLEEDFGELIGNRIERIGQDPSNPLLGICVIDENDPNHSYMLDALQKGHFPSEVMDILVNDTLEYNENDLLVIDVIRQHANSVERDGLLSAVRIIKNEELKRETREHEKLRIRKFYYTYRNNFSDDMFEAFAPYM
ncbi:MAG: hypothetical protein K6E75_09285 [Lachnospiraceae bacterium]|nr:hypothetical protein [Lachnospiraceae bacterium]